MVVVGEDEEAAVADEEAEEVEEDPGCEWREVRGS